MCICVYAFQSADVSAGLVTDPQDNTLVIGMDLNGTLHLQFIVPIQLRAIETIYGCGLDCTDLIQSGTRDEGPNARSGTHPEECDCAVCDKLENELCDECNDSTVVSPYDTLSMLCVPEQKTLAPPE